MADRKAIQRIFGEFGHSTGLDGLALDDDGYCCLLIDKDLVINIEHDEPGQRLVLYSVVGEAGDRLAALLEANYLGQGTGGATLGLQPGSTRAVLSREVPVAGLDVPAFSAALERFVNTTEDWTRRLAAPAESAAPAYTPGASGIRG